MTSTSEPVAGGRAGPALGPTLWLGVGSSPVPLSDPTIIAMPLGFLGCVVGSVLAPRATQIELAADAPGSAPAEVDGIDA